MKRSSYTRPASAALIALAAVCGISMPIYHLENETYIKHTGVESDMHAISTQLRLYRHMNGFFPSTGQGLGALVVKPETEPRPERWYSLFSKQPDDPWGDHYIYRCPGTKHPDDYDLFSAGPDHEPDTADDDWGG